MGPLGNTALNIVTNSDWLKKVDRRLGVRGNPKFFFKEVWDVSGVLYM